MQDDTTTVDITITTITGFQIRLIEVAPLKMTDIMMEKLSMVNRTGNVRTNVTLRRVRVTIVAAGKQ